MSVIELAESMARGAGDLLVAHYGNLRRTDADRKRGLRRDLGDPEAVARCRPSEA